MLRKPEYRTMNVEKKIAHQQDGSKPDEEHDQAENPASKSDFLGCVQELFD